MPRIAWPSRLAVRQRPGRCRGSGDSGAATAIESLVAMALIVTILPLSARSRVTLVKGISGRSLNQSRISAGDALSVRPRTAWP